jgi:protein tyrosine phosphatase
MVLFGFLNEEEMFGAKLFVHQLADDVGVGVGILLIVETLMTFVFTFLETAAFMFYVDVVHCFTFVQRCRTDRQKVVQNLSVWVFVPV